MPDLNGRVKAGATGLITVIMAAASLLSAPVANAAKSPVPAAQINLPFTKTLSFGDGTPASILTLPVPPGMVPVAITGQLTSSLQRVAEVTAVPSPAKTINAGITEVAVGKVQVPIRVPLAQARIVDGFVSVAFDVVDPVNTNYCAPSDPGFVTLNTVVMQLSGVPDSPTSPANFITPAVTQVSVVIPDAPTSPMLEAGLSAVATLSTAVAQGAKVRLFTQSEFGVQPPLREVRGRKVSVRIGEGPVTTAVVAPAGQVPELIVTGSANLLTAGLNALGSQFIAFADGKRTAGLAQSTSIDPSLTHKLTDFGLEPTVALTGYGSSSRAVTIQQASFAGPISSVGVHLVATNTAIPADVLASVNVFWNEALIGSYTLDGSETSIDEQVTAPSTQLTASSQFKIEFTAVPRKGDCTGASGQLPVGLYVDAAATTMTATRGEALAPGFPRFPQALAGVLPVAFSTGLDSAVAASSAGDIVAALQLVNPAPLTIQVVDPSDFISDCSTGLFVGATADDATAMTAPVRLSAFRTVGGNAISFTVGVDQAVAVFEAFERPSCNVLMLAGWGPESQSAQVAKLAQEVARYTADVEFGWTSLYANVLVGLPEEKQPIQISTGELVPQQAVIEGYRPYGWYFAIAVALIAVVGIFGAWRRRRRSAKVRRYLEVEARIQRENEPRSEDSEAPNTDLSGPDLS